MLYPKVLVLGDCIKDVFRLDPGAIGGRNVEPIDREGGALFVRNTLLDAFQSDHAIRSSVQQSGGNTELDRRISTYAFTDDHRPGHTEWHIKDFAGKLRCETVPRAAQPIQLNNMFEGYSPHLGSFDLNDFGVCIIEDLSLDRIIEHYANSDSAKPNDGWHVCSYKYENYCIPEIIKELGKKSLTAKAVNNYAPMLFLMANREIPQNFSSYPWRITRHSSSPSPFRALLDRTVVVVHADALRWSGAHISKQISWERTAQDFLSQWYCNPKLRFLRNFGHVVVRFGVTGAIYSYRLGSRRVHRLLYDPEAGEVGAHRDVVRDGDLVGHQTLLVSRIVLELARKATMRDAEFIDQMEVADDVSIGIRKAIKHMQLIYDLGFGETDKALELFQEKHTRFASPFGLLLTDPERAEQIEGETSPIADERIPVGCASWNLLTQTASYRLPEIARSIVLEGIAKTLNKREQIGRPPETDDTNVRVPVIRFGAKADADPLVVVDRREIESYRVVRNTIRKHVAASSRQLMSMAIFGPPGSGKTYVVRKIVGSAIPAGTYEFATITLAQCKSPKVLKEKFENLESVANHKEGKFPILFLDEFDASLDGQKLGWLQHLLQHMDKEFPGLLVFAGGTTQSYSEFAREELSTGDHERADFRSRKGPDFVSRLRGHINILGPNKLDNFDEGYIIRRAVVMRSMFERALSRRGIHRPSVTSMPLYVSEEIVQAMLAVGKYKHGSRSMQAIIDMCMRLGGEVHGKFVSSTLPTYEQLNMHVDGAEFMARVEHALAIPRDRELFSDGIVSGGDD